MRASGEVLPPAGRRWLSLGLVTAAGCAVSLRSCPATSRAQGGSACRASPATCFPPGETSSDSSRGSFSRCFLVFIPWKFFPASPVLAGVHGRERSGRDGSALWHPSSVLVSLHLCWHKACAGTSSSLGFWLSIPLELLVNY